VHELIPIGPVSVRIKLEKEVKGQNLKLLVSDEKLTPTVKDRWCEFELRSILNHEVVVIS
jgi:hypothetical protein